MESSLMQWQINSYFIALVIAGLISFVNVLVVLQRNRVTGSMPLLGMMTAACLWSFTYGFELASVQLPWQVFWAKVEYFGIVSVPTFFLIFALEYAQYKQALQRKTIYLLWVIPVVCLAMVWTNDLHHLIWEQISQKQSGGFYLLALTHGFVFWIWAFYSYMVLLSGSVILIRRTISNSSEFKQQAAVMVLGVAITWLGNVIYLFKLSPVPDLDITPITFVLSMTVFSIGLFRFGILNILPIAGETVLESLDDIVIVLDGTNRIMYINTAFEYYTGVDAKRLVGRMASDVFSTWPGLVALTDSQSTVRGEVVLTTDGREPFYFDARISSVRWKNRKLGRVFILEDISERRRAERNLMALTSGTSDFVSGDSVPVIFVLHLPSENIIELNRSFVVNLGYERKDAVGRSLLNLGMWDPYQRAEFMRVLGRDNSIDDYPLIFANLNGVKRSFMVSAHRLNIESDRYVMVAAKLVNE
jgi:PAS domain S-box-containing protein